MKKFTELPLLAQMGIFLAVAVAIAAVGEYYYPGLQDMQAANTAKKDKLKKQQDENAVIKPFENKLKEIQTDNKRLEIQLANSNSVVPADKDTDAFIRMVEEAGNMAGVEIRRFTAAAPQPKESYVEAPFELEIDGNYGSVMQFFDKLSRLSRIVNVSNLSMGPSGSLVKGVRKRYEYGPNTTILASFVATTFFRRELAPPGKAAPPPKK